VKTGRRPEKHAAPVRRATHAGGDGYHAGLRAGDPRARRTVVEHDPVARRELAEVLLRLDTTMLMVTHNLPYALQLCPCSVLLDDGVVVADGLTRELLADPEPLRQHRLELPYGFTGVDRR
jgi:hypothetical protein